MESRDLADRIAARLRSNRTQPVAQVVIEELWLAVVDGTLDGGERLPTSRQLAIALGVSPRSIARAYEGLERRGVIVSRQGAGTFVGIELPPESERERQRQFAELCRDAAERATSLGFDIDELIDALAEFRTADLSQERDHE